MVDRLESEKQAKMEGKVKFERELEQVEENYRKEIDDLWSMVKSLQNENKQLSASLSDQEPSSPISTGRDEDIKVMVGLRDQTEKHKDQIKQLQRELIDKATELENWQSDVERLTRQNKELQRKSKAIQNQGRVLVEEKSELICQLQAREEQLIGLQHRLAETDRARKDYEQIQAEERDKDDRDNTPRFTLAELREVLQEKNSLKARVMELEEELEQLRPHSNLSADKTAAAGQTVRFRREGTPYEEEEMTGSITTTTGRTSGEAEQPIEFALDVAPGASSSSASAAGGPRRSSIRSWLPKISHTPDGKL
uniref:RH2 domain-containing protein n=1 Tax=Plectus sambesii TaxID=2011161 RepID=A0A914XL51_9BILA